MAKVMGSLAMKKAQHNDRISGVLVKRNFNYHILAPQDLTSKSRKFHFLEIAFFNLAKSS